MYHPLWFAAGWIQEDWIPCLPDPGNRAFTWKSALGKELHSLLPQAGSSRTWLFPDSGPQHLWLADFEVLIGDGPNLRTKQDCLTWSSNCWQILPSTGPKMKAASILALTGCLATVTEPQIYPHCKLANILLRAGMDNFQGFSLENCEISPFLFSFYPWSLLPAPHPANVKGPF